jgi:hypothetical protein
MRAADLQIDDDVYEAAEKLAAAENRSVGKVLYLTWHAKAWSQSASRESFLCSPRIRVADDHP